MSLEPGDWTAWSAVLIFMVGLLVVVINGFRKSGERPDKDSPS